MEMKAAFLLLVIAIMIPTAPSASGFELYYGQDTLQAIEDSAVYNPDPGELRYHYRHGVRDYGYLYEDPDELQGSAFATYPYDYPDRRFPNAIYTPGLGHRDYSYYYDPIYDSNYDPAYDMYPSYDTYPYRPSPYYPEDFYYDDPDYGIYIPSTAPGGYASYYDPTDYYPPTAYYPDGDGYETYEIDYYDGEPYSQRYDPGGYDRGHGYTSGGGLYVKRGYPKGPDFVFVCDLEDFDADSYSWYYGDGEKLQRVVNRDTYHVFEYEGTFEVTCVGHSGGHSSKDSVIVKVSSLDRPSGFEREMRKYAVSYHDS